jgi:hypothetical protein
LNQFNKNKCSINMSEKGKVVVRAMVTGGAASGGPPIA